MIKNPPQTSDDLKKLYRYDPETGLFFRVSKGTLAGKPDDKGYIRIAIWGRCRAAHRLAWLYVHGEWPSDQIDHINGAKDDNRIANLRIATNRQNVQNRPAQANNRLGIRGVRRHPRTGLYEAWIWVNGKRTFLGCSKDPQIAGEAYAAAAHKYFGEFCHQSIPPAAA